MVEQARRKLKTKRREKNRSDFGDPTKEEYGVAKYVRFNCLSKTATIMGNEMAYFTASKALDCLMSSKYAGDTEKHLFSNRNSAIFYMQNLLDKGLFFRAKKLVPKKKDSLTGQVSAKYNAAEQSDVGDVKKTEKRKTKTEKEMEEKKEKVSEKIKEDVDEKTKSGGKKKTKKVKFDIHQNQVFNDGNDIYVWKYDPTSTKMFLLGLAVVLCAIGVCLFPLWPPEVRICVYYLSIAAMVFVGFIVFLVILRTILFSLVWASTFGKHHFWLLPHLTDDCGFFESFKPLYSHKIMENGVKKSSDEKDNKEIESKRSANEENSSLEKDSDEEKVVFLDGEHSNGENNQSEMSSDEEEDDDNLSVVEMNGETESVKENECKKKK
uniref:Translocation protein SEC62 n=1 Tax=Romanomermis culicivorax TaxID=13658 RepID=A0A915JFU1_ROMCU